MNKVANSPENGHQLEPAPFDLWLRRGIVQQYGEVLHEPIPAEIMDVLTRPD